LKATATARGDQPPLTYQQVLEKQLRFARDAKEKARFCLRAFNFYVYHAFGIQVLIEEMPDKFVVRYEKQEWRRSDNPMSAARAALMIEEAREIYTLELWDDSALIGRFLKVQDDPQLIDETFASWEIDAILGRTNNIYFPFLMANAQRQAQAMRAQEPVASHTPGSPASLTGHHEDGTRPPENTPARELDT
jgi:hypothetical protein